MILGFKAVTLDAYNLNGDQKMTKENFMQRYGKKCYSQQEQMQKPAL